MTTAVLWMRGILEHEYGVPLKSIEWFAELEDDVEVTLPKDLKLTRLPHEKSVETMLAEGELDAVLHSDLIKPFLAKDARVARLFPSYKDQEIAYYKKTGIFPIMHVLGLKQSLAEQHPWIAVSLYKAFNEAKAIAMERMQNPAHRAAGLVSRGLGGTGENPRARPVGIRPDRQKPEKYGNAGELFP